VLHGRFSHIEWRSRVVYFILFLIFFCLFRAAPVACGGSQARGLIGVVATSRHHSHSNARSEPRLRPAPQLTAMRVRYLALFSGLGVQR